MNQEQQFMTTSTNKPLLNCIEINPQTPAIGSVIWLHGLGADGNDFVPIVPELKLPATLPIRFIFPNAPMRPVTINNGYVMPAWYDIFSMAINQRIDSTGIAESVKQIEQIIAREEQRGIPSNKIVLAGFSQGSVVALTTGLGYAKKLAGILALSGYLPDADQAMASASTENKTTPIFVGHGISDTVVPQFLGLHAYDVLNRNGYPVSWHSYMMQHSVCEEEIADIGTWLQKVF